MDYGRRHSEYASIVFSAFVCVSLSMLLGLHAYSYFWGPTQETLDGDLSDIKYVVSQLSRSLTDVNRKHDLLQGELEHVLSVIPNQIDGDRKQSKEDSEALRRKVRYRLIGDVYNYDRKHVDFALESAGAKILDTGNSVDYVKHESSVGWFMHTVVAWMCNECLGARAIIQPGTLPGECWAFTGSKGEVTIRLLGTVRITGFSLEHIPVHIASTGEISSAPRLCQVEGLEHRWDQYPHDFGSFEYDKNGEAIQDFEVLYPSAVMYNIVRLRILTNWGNPVYTCVYRFRVHGELAPGQGPKITEVIDGSKENDKK